MNIDLRSWWRRAKTSRGGKGKKNRQLWGQEFRTVKDGLDEAQVVNFVNDLITQARTRAEQQNPLYAASKRVIAEAEREAATLRLRAKREAEVEATRIITEAKQQAQETMSQAQRQAATYTQKEVEKVLLTAKKKAELTESQARQMAQLLFLRAREELQNHLTTEVKEAYYRLLSTLQDMLSTAQTIESEWKTKTVELWEGQALASGEYELGLLDTLGSGRLLKEAPPAAEVREGVAPEELRPRLIPQAEVVAETPGESPGEEALPRAKAEALPLEPEVIPVSAAPLRKEQAAPPAPEERGELKTEEKGLEGMGEGEETKPLGSNLYSGEVELVMEPPVDVLKVSELYNRLQAIPELKVLRTVGSWDRGTTVTIRLDRPLALISLLETIPVIETHPSAQTPLGEKAQRVGISFKAGSEGTDTRDK